MRVAGDAPAVAHLGSGVGPHFRSGVPKREMSEPNHYEPPPEPHPQWHAGAPVESTPERWFEPEPDAAAPRGLSRGLIAALMATSLVGAVIGGSGTFLLLRTIDGAATPSPAP